MSTVNSTTSFKKAVGNQPGQNRALPKKSDKDKIIIAGVKAEKTDAAQSPTGKAEPAYTKPPIGQNPREQSDPKLFVKSKIPPAMDDQAPPFMLMPPTADHAYAPGLEHQQHHHERLYIPGKSGKNAADLNMYSFGQYQTDNKRAGEQLIPLFQEIRDLLVKEDPKNNKTLQALMFDQSKKWDMYHDRFANIWTDIAGIAKKITDKQSLDYGLAKDLRKKLRTAEDVPVPKIAREAVNKLNGLLREYDEWRRDPRNHALLKTESTKHHANEFRKRMVGYRKELRDKYHEGYRTEKLKALQSDDAVARSRGTKGKLKEDMEKEAKAYADEQTKREFDYDGKSGGRAGQGVGIAQYFNEFNTLSQKDFINAFDNERNAARAVGPTLGEPLRRMNNLFNGIKLSSQSFADHLNERMEDRFFDKKIAGRVTSKLMPQVGPGLGDDDTPDSKFKKIVNFISDGYGYQQMADLVRQYVHTFNDYQNIALDLAKMGSGRQVQEIERMVRARINMGDQRDTFRTLRDYNSAVHSAHMDSLGLENDVVSMEGEKRRTYVEKMKRMLDNATRDRMVDMESQRSALVNAALLRDTQAKVESAEQDLANQTLQSAQGIMAKQFQGAALSEAQREKLAQVMMEMELERSRNTFNRLKSIVQLMRY